MPRLVVGLWAAFLAFAQDPYALFPRNYSLEFENEFVRISRVRYYPGDKLPEHSHPALPTVYIYIRDGGPIRFTHTKPKFTLERPAVKAGTVRFNRNAQVETHETEYLGDSETEYLRLELKTEPGPPHRDARLRAVSDFPWEDDQVRISRIEGGSAPRPGVPGVIVDVDARRFVWSDPKEDQTPPLRARTLIIVELKSRPQR